MPLGQHEQVTARSIEDQTMPHHLEAGSLYQRKARRGIVVAPVHWRAVVLLRPGRQVGRPKAKKRQPSGPQYTGEAVEDSSVLVARYVNDGVVRAYRVEGRIRERQCDEVRTNPNSCGHVMSGEAELYLGKVDPDDIGTSSKPPGDGDAGPATRVKDTCPRRKADNEILQQRNVRRIATTRRQVRRRDAIVRLADLRFAIHDS